jgi:hypothetical protein
MSLVTDLIPVVDGARKIIEEIGFRLNRVSLTRIVWSNGIGIGTPTSVTEVIMSPQPKILKYTTEQIILSGGAITAVDLNVSKISKIYTLTDLTGGTLTRNEEFFWNVDGVYYTPVGHQERPIGWNVQIRRTNRKALLLTGQTP